MTYAPQRGDRITLQDGSSAVLFHTERRGRGRIVLAVMREESPGSWSPYKAPMSGCRLVRRFDPLTDGCAHGALMRSMCADCGVRS